MSLPFPFLYLTQLIMRVCILLSTLNLEDLFAGKIIPQLDVEKFFIIS